MRKVPQKSIAVYGVAVALSLVLSYIESILPVDLVLPGAKIGLPNIVSIFLLYTAGAGGCALVAVLRIVLAGFMFGNMFSIIYSLSGFLFSFVSMLLMKRSGRFGVTGVSITGGIMHNAGQLICASFIAGPYVMTYLPALAAAGTAAGLLIGLAGAEMIRRVGRYMK